MLSPCRPYAGVPWAGADVGAPDDRVAAQQPESGGAIVILPENVGLAVAVVIAGFPLICQEVSALAAIVPPPITLVPFSCQVATEPLSFCQRMSDLPSPLKSPVPLMSQVPSRVRQTTPPPITLVPFSSQIAGVPSVVLPEVSDLPSPLKSPPGQDVPAKVPWVRPDGPPADHADAVQLPDRRRAVGFLPENVRLAVAIEVAAANDMPRQSPGS